MKTVELVNDLFEECSTHFWTSVSQWLNTQHTTGFCVWSVADYNLQSLALNVLKQLSAALTNWSAILGTRIPELVLRQFGNNVPGHLQILIRTYIRRTQQCHFEWSWVTLSWLSKIFNDAKHQTASLRQQSYLYNYTRSHMKWNYVRPQVTANVMLAQVTANVMLATWGPGSATTIAVFCLICYLWVVQPVGGTSSIGCMDCGWELSSPI